MAHAGKWKDYRLNAANSVQAEKRGLVSAHWFRCEVPRAQMKQLMQRSDAQGLRHMAIWLALLTASGVAAWQSHGSWWCLPAFFLYGTLYSVSDHCAHELSHGTPFKTPWLNNVFYQLASFMTLHESVYWRWSHARHHTDTIIVGRDREIAFPRPARPLAILFDAFFLPGGLQEIARTVRHAMGSLSEETRSFIPDSEIRKLVWSSRIYTLLFAGLIAWCVLAQSILPALFIVLPRFYGALLPLLFNMTQHTGLAEDVLDHRLNTRTMYLNPVFEFLYMKMNYHLEHHMFPMVPFHALPRLHAAIREQSPPAYGSLWAAYADIVPAVLRQREEPGHVIAREASRA